MQRGRATLQSRPHRPARPLLGPQVRSPHPVPGSARAPLSRRPGRAGCPRRPLRQRRAGCATPRGPGPASRVPPAGPSRASAPPAPAGRPDGPRAAPRPPASPAHLPGSWGARTDRGRARGPPGSGVRPRRVARTRRRAARTPARGLPPGRRAERAERRAPKGEGLEPPALPPPGCPDPRTPAPATRDPRTPTPGPQTRLTCRCAPAPLSRLPLGSGSRRAAHGRPLQASPGLRRPRPARRAGKPRPQPRGEERGRRGPVQPPESPAMPRGRPASSPGLRRLRRRRARPCDVSRPQTTRPLRGPAPAPAPRGAQAAPAPAPEPGGRLVCSRPGPCSPISCGLGCGGYGLGCGGVGPHVPGPRCLLPHGCWAKALPGPGPPAKGAESLSARR